MAPYWSKSIPFLLQMLIIKILTKVEATSGKPTPISMEKNEILRIRPPYLHMIMKCLIKQHSNVGVCDLCQVTAVRHRPWKTSHSDGPLRSEMGGIWNLWRKMSVRQGCVWLHSTAAWLWHLDWITEGHERDIIPHMGDPCTVPLAQVPQLLHPYRQQ